MVTGVAPGLQNRCGARTRPGWVRFPHVPAILVLLAALTPALLGQEPQPREDAESGASRTAFRDSIPPVTPFGSLVRSLVIPGWGQTSVGQPTRGAIYFAAASASLFMVFKSQGKLSAARRANPPDESLIDSRNRQRENWIVLYGFVAFVSALDAWVSTQFWDFEPEVTAPEDGTIGLTLSYRVPVGRP